MPFKLTRQRCVLQGQPAHLMAMFSRSSRTRWKRRVNRRKLNSEPYKKWIRLQPCVACRSPGPNEAAHTHGSGAGTALKGNDRRCIPLCRMDHTDGDNAYHRIGETAFCELFGIDLEAVIESLQARYRRETGREP